MSISVKNISVAIDGTTSNRFDISLDDGKVWHMENFSLCQSLLTCNSLSFSMHKDPEEDQNEPQFSICGFLIGKEIYLSLQTACVENESHYAESDGVTEDIEFPLPSFF